MSEIGAVYSVGVEVAGGWLVGDHDADVEELAVDAAWDFDPAGGTLVVAGEAYEYTSVTFVFDEDTGEPVDDEPATIVLTSGLVADAVDGDPVETFPQSESKTAMVEAKGFGEPVAVRVPHDLYDKLPEGTWGNPSEAPTVSIVADGDGWVIEDVLGVAPVVDGGYIDPDTMPPAAPQEAVTPPAVSTPDLAPMGLNALRASWTPVENPSSVMYDVSVSESTLFPPGSVGVAFTTAASSVSFEWPWGSSGTKLQPDTDYYVAVRSRSEDQLAEWSDWSDAAQIETVDISEDLQELQDELDAILPITETKIADDAISTPKLQAGSVVAGKIGADAVTANEIAAGSVEAEKIAAGAVNAGHISANTIEGEHIAGQVILGSDITTAESGARVGLSADQGFYAYDSEGNRGLRADGTSTSINGDATLHSLNAPGEATFSGAARGMPGGGMVLGDRLGPPGSPPSVEAFWDTVTLDGGDVAGDLPEHRTGLVWYDDHWWVASIRSSVGDAALYRFNSDGSFDSVYWSLGSSNRVPGSLTLMGSTFYLHFAGTNEVRAITDFATDHLVSLADTNAAMRSGVLGSDGTNLVLVWRNGGGNLYAQRYNTSGAKVGAQRTLAGGVEPVAVLGGSFDFGGNRLVVAGPSNVSTFTGFTGNVSENTGERFSSPGLKGLAWDGVRFAALTNGGGTIRLHTAALKDEPATNWVDLYAGNTWSASGYETMVGPRSIQRFYKRAKHRMRTAERVPATGGPTGARFYVGRTASRAKLEDQGGASPGAGNFVEGEVSSVSLPSGTADATDPPPASGTFPTSTPYKHTSEATDSGGNPLVDLRGSGYAGGQGLRPVGEITMFGGSSAPTAEWLVCNGSAISRSTYARLFATIGTTYGSGNGSTTFNVPDLRSRFAVGAGSYTSLGGSDGASESNRTPAHDHSSGSLTTGSPSGTVARATGAGEAAGPGHNHAISGRTEFNLGANAPDGSQFPRLAVTYIIRAL